MQKQLEILCLTVFFCFEITLNLLHEIVCGLTVVKIYIIIYKILYLKGIQNFPIYGIILHVAYFETAIQVAFPLSTFYSISHGISNVFLVT